MNKPPQISAAEMQKRRHERSRMLAQAVVEAFTERLKEELMKQGGTLGQPHVEALNTEFQAKADQLTAVFEKALSETAREQEASRWHAIKRPAFDRLMVKRFEHLFIRRGDDGRIHGSVSRRVLPGFFLGLNMMLGPELLERYQKRCDEAVERVMKGTLPVDWVRVEHDDEVQKTILDAQLAIARHFEDVERRGAWFLHIINTHLAPVADEHAPDAVWEMTLPPLLEMVLCLLSDLKAVVANDVAWALLATRHPEANRHDTALTLERFD